MTGLVLRIVCASAYLVSAPIDSPAVQVPKAFLSELPSFPLFRTFSTRFSLLSIITPCSHLLKNFHLCVLIRKIDTEASVTFMGQVSYQAASTATTFARSCQKCSMLEY